MISTLEKFFVATGFTDDEIVRRLQDGGAMVVDASLAKEEASGATITIPGDSHPTPYANRVRALLIKNYIEQHVSRFLLSTRDGAQRNFSAQN